MINRNISKIGLGTGRLSSLGESISQKQCNELIKTALENGITVLDTADTYGSGDAERMLGKSITGMRENFFVITKAGFPHVSLPGWLSPVNQIGKKVMQKLNYKQNFSKIYLLKALHKSLKRLNVEAVDAFVLHEPLILELTDDSWAALEKISTSGMARYTGVSTSDHKVVLSGIESKQIQIVETPVSLLKKNENEIVRLCNESQIPIVANQVLAGYHHFKRNNEIKLKAIQEKYNIDDDLVKFFIGYVVGQPGIISTLIGTKNNQHLIINSKIINNTEKHFDLYTEIQSLNI